MASSLSLLDRVFGAQTGNSTLRGEELSAAARNLADRVAHDDWRLMAVDGAGERIIAAALDLSPQLQLTDASRRLDGLSIMLVAGYAAGEAGIQHKAGLARRLGAVAVQVTHLGQANRETTA
ncbi:hypothetical protein [Nesterenkonia halotolerans]|uniref:Chloramphenicol 3-O-phosphotransferase n=1 Tax=Nesterenkonia halotolerans TaxID=225325 RepID=A0ABR9J5P5_9MICC|nr:hypothetical protein [Nesterenkonia halotolerans]MBE1514313.1 chloramphenicol 3-O-phosphotransferase [Nesterenkonia halotolerans]